jgi:hypothetical protein
VPYIGTRTVRRGLKRKKERKEKNPFFGSQISQDNNNNNKTIPH